MKRKLFLALIAVLSLGVSWGCGVAPKSQDNLSILQQNKYLKVRLYGVMTFDFGGEPMTWPTELKTASVPLVWMGQVFNGKSVASGPEYNFVDQVHGSVSPDGEWVLNLSYTRQIIRTQDSVYYSVSLRNVPVVSSANSTMVVGKFDKKGDIQKYVENIEYRAEGRLVNLKIPATTYSSIDWTNTLEGQQPALKLLFELKPSEILGAPSTGMGMGQ
jgi:hypothetical protein